MSERWTRQRHLQQSAGSNDEHASHRMHQAECSYQSHPYEQDRKHPDELGCGLPRESRQHRNHQKWQACQHTTKGEKYS